eukprot:364662-Chlamydomonas_euryale.AAC.2
MSTAGDLAAPATLQPAESPFSATSVGCAAIAADGTAAGSAERACQTPALLKDRGGDAGGGSRWGGRGVGGGYSRRRRRMMRAAAVLSSAGGWHGLPLERRPPQGTSAGGERTLRCGGGEWVRETAGYLPEREKGKEGGAPPGSRLREPPRSTWARRRAAPCRVRTAYRGICGGIGYAAGCGGGGVRRENGAWRRGVVAIAAGSAAKWRRPPLRRPRRRRLREPWAFRTGENSATGARSGRRLRRTSVPARDCGNHLAAASQSGVDATAATRLQTRRPRIHAHERKSAHAWND